MKTEEMKAEDAKSMEFQEELAELEDFTIKLARATMEYAKSRKLTLKERFNLRVLKWKVERYEKQKAKRK